MRKNENSNATAVGDTWDICSTTGLAAQITTGKRHCINSKALFHLYTQKMSNKDYPHQKTAEEWREPAFSLPSSYHILREKGTESLFLVPL